MNKLWGGKYDVFLIIKISYSILDFVKDIVFLWFASYCKMLQKVHIDLNQTIELIKEVIESQKCTKQCWWRI